MKAIVRLSEKQIDPRKAAAPNKGAAAFFCSTENKGLSGKAMFPIVSQHIGRVDGSFYNLLTETHYFRRCLAKRPLAIVVLTEGQRTTLEKLREATT